MIEFVQATFYEASVRALNLKSPNEDTSRIVSFGL